MLGWVRPGEALAVNQRLSKKAETRFSSGVTPRVTFRHVGRANYSNSTIDREPDGPIVVSL